MKRIIACCCVVLIFLVAFFSSVVSAAEFQTTAAPDFALRTSEGDTVTLADYKGKSNVILMFWTINGLYCPYELKGLRDRYAELQGNNFEVLAVNLKEQSAAVQDFVTQEALPFPVLLDADGSVAKQYEITGLPVFLIIDTHGTIQWRGYRFPARYTELVHPKE